MTEQEPIQTKNQKGEKNQPTAYKFHCSACNELSHTPGYCKACASEIEDYLDWLEKTNPRFPLPEDFAPLTPNH